MNKDVISIVIINYNSSNYTIDCINSIFEKVSSSLAYSIVIVDNNSKSEDYNTLYTFVQNLPRITIIRSNINLGFSGGNMLGVQHVHAQYVLFLNNDTQLLNDCLSIMIDFMKAEPRAGICTAQMYNTDLSFRQSFSYFPSLKLRLLGSGILKLYNPTRYKNRRIEYSQAIQVDFVFGAAMLVDFSKFAQVGGFDTNLFLYCEEEDIAQKMRKLGYTAHLVPQAKYIHHVGKSTGQNIAIDKEYYISMMYYQKKYYSWPIYTTHRILYFFKFLRKSFKHQNNLKLAFFILFFAGLKHSLKFKQKIRINE